MSQTWQLTTHQDIMAALELAAELNNDNLAVVMVKGYGDDHENFTAIYLSEFHESREEGTTFAEWLESWSDCELWYDPAHEGEVNTAKIRALNDAFRANPANFHMTQQVAFNSPEARAKICNMVSLYSDFAEGNDPYRQHDFGAFDFEECKYFWKIDYYDPSMQYGSENPADPKQTKRVLTIMRAHEY